MSKAAKCRTLWSLLVVASSALVVGACSAQPREGASSVNDYTFFGELTSGTVSRCHDGDTCTVALDAGGNLTVRLAGIDAPEVNFGGQPLGREAGDFINSMIKGQKVQVRQIEHDVYGRTIGEIYTANFTLVNLRMVAEGFAEVYRGSTKQISRETYAKREQDAKSAKLRIWGLENYESPAAFRRRMKAQQAASN